jgi:ribosomal protein L29
MNFPKYKNLESFKSEIEIDEEIFLLKKSLIELKFQAVSRKIKLHHVYRFTKRRISQLLFKKSNLKLI